ncbi:3D (Asp-Asp-Asp) domain-containing protein [Paenibacillus uliginis N3/975]|uniref:3D (Asp-Asp-Asp) domain-containing protein n=1 Tax=Paenibacillus uliginis N3/975 TaxID=1313296 RepID=A0A1X7HGI6_9BACL|nr:3D domain-containing protein [Paenibacillus uliginis]SMF86231.1 3D (Asp-Asp-Asp) domain-containing protein [Paenibacillus uliginis N3/975]
MIQNMKWWHKKNDRNETGTKGKTVKLLTAAVLALGLTFGATTVPAEAATTHVAKQGDTYYFLAKRYGVNLNKLMQANPNIKAKNIYPGLKIKIPAAPTMKAASVPAASVMVPNLNVNASSKVVEAWGKTFNYSKTASMKATAYSSAASENGKWGAVDYFGNPLKLGTIAVDPKVIPLGTKVLVTGHSHSGLPNKAFVAVARDIGGAIKGNRVDIFIPGSQKSVSQFGIQNVKLYFIK